MEQGAPSATGDEGSEHLLDGASSGTDQCDALSPRAAAERYDLVAQTLVLKLRLGEIPGYKVRGPRGREWRVSTAALEAYGYRPREQQASREPSPEVAELQATIRELRRTVAFERRRADELDRLLGEASLEIGRLRAQMVRQREPEHESDQVIDLRTEAADRPTR
jgi:hypothetical protein